MTEEIWLPIVPIVKKSGRIFTPYNYEVSNFGRVRTKRQRYGRPLADTGRRADLQDYRIINGRADANGYILYNLYDYDHNKTNIRGHVLVMQTFVGVPQKDQMVCHYDDVKTNNRLDNLRYGTHKENMEDRLRNSKSNKTV